MRIGRARPHHRWLDDGQRTRAMVWIMAIMLFLTVLAGALGFGMAGAGRSLERQLAGRLTVQLIEADAARRDANTRALVERIRAIPGVKQVVEVDRARLAELLRPWLGDAGLDAVHVPGAAPGSAPRSPKRHLLFRCSLV